MSNPFPNKFITKLRFQAVHSLNGGIGTLGFNTFRANSVYDPDFTGVGAQPRYFDEIMPLYDHFVVIGAKITATYINENNESYFIAVNRNDNGITSNNINDVIEQRNATYTYLGPATGGNNIKKLSLTYSPKRFLGRSKPLADPDLKGGVSSNPSEGMYFSVCAGAADAVSDPTAITCNVVIDYIVAFIEPKRIGSS